ncbi:A24 family peptidase|uniref:A24 family peptidase n=1 Tax=Noviherbaspirillum sp. L7-7A TaxID=2850560 RepID=UPI001C2C26B7|nr:A24 family peptidase [Noviherbaspirillum sp. L7-7A]MBV0881084.1 A24 family peptidase [Noviherbaspirillum sp. L7-7A]
MQEFKSFLELLGMLATDTRSMVLLLLLTIAAVIDYRTFRIPNWLTFSGMVFGLGYSLLNPGTTSHGVLWSLTGLGFGFAVMLPMYMLRVMGAGDVKLMAMAGSLLGLEATFYAVLCTFIVGGVASIGFAATHRVLGKMLANIRDIARLAAMSIAGGMRPDIRVHAAQSVGRLPYGVSIAIGTSGFVLARHFGYL